MPEASSHTVFSNTLHSQDQVQIWWHCSVNALCRVDWRRSPSLNIRVTFTAQTVSSVSVKQLKKTSNEQHEFKVSSFSFNVLLACWFLFQSGFRFGFSAWTEENCSSRSCSFMFSFLFLLFICDNSFSLPLPTAAVSAGLIVSKGQIDYFTWLSFFFFPLSLALFMNFRIVVFTFYFRSHKLVLPQTLAINYN